VKIVAAPADATLVGGLWYAADGTEIGPAIWGEFATIQENLQRHRDRRTTGCCILAPTARVSADSARNISHRLNPFINKLNSLPQALPYQSDGAFFVTSRPFYRYNI